MNPVATLVVALFAGAAAGILGSRLAVPADPGVVPATANELLPRLLELEAKVAALGFAAAVPAPAVAAERSVDPAREPAEVVDGHARQRLESLETAVARLQQTNQAARSAVVRDPATEAGAPKKTAAEHRFAIVAAGANEADQLAAWRQLRNLDNAYDDATVAVMVQVGLASKNPETRADVWRQADGRSKHPALAPALMQSLQSDGEARVRDEAAETLENYLDVPGVREALAAAMESDADESVRRQARHSLENGRR